MSGAPRYFRRCSLGFVVRAGVLWCGLVCVYALFGFRGVEENTNAPAPSILREFRPRNVTTNDTQNAVGKVEGVSSSSVAPFVNEEDEEVTCAVKVLPGKESRRADRFLDAVLFTRFSKDKPEKNLMDWLKWAKFAGVEKVYLYDTAASSGHRCAIDMPGVKEYVADAFVVITRYPIRKWPSNLQLPIWQDVNLKYPTRQWRMYLDLDEYIFSPTDTTRGFLQRYLTKLPPFTAVVSLHNFIFGGIDLLEYEVNISEETHSLPQRYFYRFPPKEAQADRAKKYIAHMSRTCSLTINFARPCARFTVTNPAYFVLRFNHYDPRTTMGVLERLRLEEDRDIESPFAKAISKQLPSLPGGRMEKLTRTKMNSTVDYEDKRAREKATSKNDEVKSKLRECPRLRVHDRQGASDKVIVDAAVYVRLTSSISYHALMAWLLWHMHAGIGRMYVYDIGFSSDDKCVSSTPGIEQLVKTWYLTITRWDMPKWSPEKELHIWKDANTRYPSYQWRVYTSMDEFVFSPHGNEAGFLRQYLLSVGGNVGVLSMQNYAFVAYIEPGIEQNSSSLAWPQMFTRRAAKTKHNKEQQALHRPKHIAHLRRTCALSVKRARPCAGFTTKSADPDVLHYNTYDLSRHPDELTSGDYVMDTQLAEMIVPAVLAMNKTLLKLPRDKQ